jgi:hypothetical protein
VFGSRVNLALKNCGLGEAGVDEGDKGATVGIRVEVGGQAIPVGLGISSVAGSGVSGLILNEQLEAKKTITMRDAIEVFIASPSLIVLKRVSWLPSSNSTHRLSLHKKRMTITRTKTTIKIDITTRL